MLLRNLALAVALAVPGVAWSAQCDEGLQTASAAIADGPAAGISGENFEQARSLVALATDQLNAGDDLACVQTIDKALELLGIAE